MSIQIKGNTQMKPTRKKRECTFADLEKVQHNWKEEKEQRKSGEKAGIIVRRLLWGLVSQDFIYYNISGELLKSSRQEKKVCSSKRNLVAVWRIQGGKGPDHAGPLSQGKDSEFYPKCKNLLMRFIYSNLYFIKISYLKNVMNQNSGYRIYFNSTFKIKNKEGYFCFCP